MTRKELEERVFEALSSDMMVCFEYPDTELWESVQNASTDELIDYLSEIEDF